MQPGLKVNGTRIAKLMRRDGIANHQELADQLGLHRTTVTRAMRGQCRAGGKFITATMRRFPDTRFPDLFSEQVAA